MNETMCFIYFFFKEERKKETEKGRKKEGEKDGKKKRHYQEHFAPLLFKNLVICQSSSDLCKIRLFEQC